MPSINFNVCFPNEGVFDAEFESMEVVTEDDYSRLHKKPKINGVEVNGDKTSEEYGLQDKITFCTNCDIDELFR